MVRGIVASLRAQPATVGVEESQCARRSDCDTRQHKRGGSESDGDETQAAGANEQLKRRTLASGAASRQRDDEGASAASHRRRRGCSRETQRGERQGNATGYITIATNATDGDAYPQRGLGDEGSEGTGCRPRDSWGNPHRDPDAVQGPREGPGQMRVAFYEVIGRVADEIWRSSQVWHISRDENEMRE